MRMDKYLQLSRLVKRRRLAHDICAAGRVRVNGKKAKPGTAVEKGDQIEIVFGNRVTAITVCEIRTVVRKDEASQLYEVTSERLHDA